MIGTFQGFRVTTGSFGQQYRRIDGWTYVTYFDAADPKLKGLEAGVLVEFERRPAPTVLCRSPHVSVDAPSAVLMRVVGRGEAGPRRANGTWKMANGGRSMSALSGRRNEEEG